ncbi:hypothetical protein [Streptomyces sp. TR02-1]|uniref:hypothetical protein n=1 Tax=Streptomyces sp. TR02-1 TaxID=3385977 RepID=UPI00399F2E84
MTPPSVLQTQHPWKVQLTETPQHARPGLYAAFGAGIGARTLDILRHNKVPISPVIACAMHMQYLVPVSQDLNVAWLLAGEAGCQLAHTADCAAQVRMGEPLSHGRLWMLPPDDVLRADRTDLRSLYEAYRTQKNPGATSPVHATEHERVDPVIVAAA